MAAELPKEFIKSIECYPGLAEALMSTSPQVSIRLNKKKAQPTPEILNLADGQVPWCPEGFYLKERPNFTLDPAFHQGRYYVQDASAMYVTNLVKSLGLESPIRFLDACAAPGGKTTAIIDNIPNGSYVVANEFEPKRAAILRENLAKWGYPYYVVTQGDTAKFRSQPSAFDLILADVPCSGEGMMRKDSQAVAQWSEKLVADCASLQRRIIDNLWPALAPGGFFIYATCTFNPHENEENVDYIIKEYSDENGVPEVLQSRRFLPGRDRGEGQFMALIRKPGQWEGTESNGSVRGKKSRLAPPPQIITHTPIAAKGKEKQLMVPTQEYCLSTIYPPNAYPSVEVDYNTALKYLRRESLSMDECSPNEDVPLGFVLLTYQGWPLGFVKNIGRRANNLYPQNWRIRM